MISREELKEYARRLSLRTLGQAEKDYFQNIILFILYQSYGKTIIFKGGTALKKVYGLDRFSEDLDFTCMERVDIRKLENGLRRFNLDFEMEKEEYEDGLKVVIRIKGPLYTGIRQSLCKFVIDFSMKEEVILKPEVKTIGRFLEEIPSFDVVVMQEREILAEKIRAVMTRVKARDVYDLWFLLRKGVEVERELVEKKLEFYGKKWYFRDFRKNLALKESVWESELAPVLIRVPKFRDVRKLILEKTGEALGKD